MPPPPAPTGSGPSGADGRDDGVGSRWPAVAVVGLSALVLGAVVALPAVVGSGRRVVIIGDSLTLVSTPALHAVLDRDNDVTTEARLGVTVEMMQPVAADLAASSPEHAVIELGTNDVLQDVPIEATAEQLEQMVTTFRDAGVPCIHVVDVNTQMQRGDGRWTTEEARSLNAATAELAAANRDVVLVGWDAALRDAGARGQDLTPDTVHPDQQGARLLADLVARSLAEGCSG